MRRPVEYLNELTEKNGIPISPPLLDEIIKQMVLFARDYSNQMTGNNTPDFEELEKVIYGVYLLPKNETNEITES